MGSMVLMPVGYALAGPVAGAIGTSATLIGGAVVTVAVSLALVSVRDVRVITRLDHDRAGEPVVALEPAAAPVD